MGNKWSITINIRIDSLICKNNYKGKEIRTVEKDSTTWWVLKDVCNVLGLSNLTMIADRLDEDEVTKFDLGGKSGISNIVNKSGLYNVILRSDKKK